MITYTKYPLLLHTSYEKQTAPDNMPFEVKDKHTLLQLEYSKAFSEFILMPVVLNTLYKRNGSTHYYLSPETFQKVEFNLNFRNTYFRDFLQKHLPKNYQYGCIIMANGGTYLYIINASKISVAIFAGDFFIAFEEGEFHNQQLSVLPTGIYTGAMEPGTLLSFCLITLSYAVGKKQLVNPAKSKVKEAIIEL